jgi:ankyrin repeat protein
MEIFSLPSSFMLFIFLFLLLTLVDSIKEMDPRLVEAALKGNTIELQKLLQEDSLLLERDSLALYPETALHIATIGGRTEFVRELLKLKPDFATRLNKDGFSAIHIASANGFVETVRELLKFSRELAHLKSSDGKTSLHCAAVTGRVRVVEELIGFFPDCVGDVTQRGETALHLAVKYNQFEAFKAMVDLSKQLNVKDILNAGDEDGNTVLHLAIARKQSQVNNSIFI